LKGGVTSLVVGLLLQPTTGIPAQVKTTAFVVHEDGDGEGNGWQPPHESARTRKQRKRQKSGSEKLIQTGLLLERVHPETLVHARSVG